VCGGGDVIASLFLLRDVACGGCCVVASSWCCFAWRSCFDVSCGVVMVVVVVESEGGGRGGKRRWWWVTDGVDGIRQLSIKSKCGQRWWKRRAGTGYKQLIV
jgi:hypothetical protein